MKTHRLPLSSASIISVLSALMLIASGCSTNTGITSASQIDTAALRQRAVDILVQCLQDSDGVIRANAAEAVAATGQTALVPIVARLLSDNSHAVRFAAAAALGDMQAKETSADIKRLLDDPDQNVRIAAAYALTKIGKDYLCDNLRQAIKQTDQTLRANAALLLGKLGDKNDLELLYQMLYDSYSFDKARIQIIESIATLGDTRIYRGKLWALLISQKADDRLMGIRCMGALGNTDAKNAISTMLDDDIIEVRLCAADELGRLGDKSGLPEVLGYFRKQNPNIDKASLANGFATLAIGNIRDKTLTQYLPAILRSQSAQMRLLAAQSALLLTKKN